MRSMCSAVTFVRLYTPSTKVRHVRQTGRIYYDVYSLEMVIAVAFRLRSREAMAFRKFIMERLYTAGCEKPVNLFFSLSVTSPWGTC